MSREGPSQLSPGASHGCMPVLGPPRGAPGHPTLPSGFFWPFFLGALSFQMVTWSPAAPWLEWTRRRSSGVSGLWSWWSSCPRCVPAWWVLWAGRGAGSLSAAMPSGSGARGVGLVLTGGSCPAQGLCEACGPRDPARGTLGQRLPGQGSGLHTGTWVPRATAWPSRVRDRWDLP